MSDRMRYLAEADSAALVNEDLAHTAARDALIAAVSPQTEVFPAVLGHGSDPRNRRVSEQPAGRSRPVRPVVELKRR